MIPYGRQTIDDDDIAAVVEVLRGDWLTQGPAVEAFERALADRVGAKHVIAFANGTAALHAAVAAAHVGPGDVLFTSSLSFVADANCGRYVGADVAFVDIDTDTLNLDPKAVPADATALVAVHFAGLPVDLAHLRHRPRIVIEDGAHALGADTPDGPVGSCAHSDMCTFSFHPVKAITTGEGGAVTTNDDELAARLRAFRTHGVFRDAGAAGWHYDVRSVGFNYRLSDIHAALGSSQLAKLDRFVAHRRRLADRYRQLLADLPVLLPPAPGPGFTHAYHLFPVRVSRRDHVYDHLRTHGVGAQVHYIPIHRHSLYAGVGGDLPNTDEAASRLLSLPLHASLTEHEQDEVVRRLVEAVA